MEKDKTKKTATKPIEAQEQNNQAQPQMNANEEQMLRRQSAPRPTIQGEASQKNKYHMVNTYTWNLER